MLCRDLREEISTVKDDCLQLQGKCWTKVAVDSEHSELFFLSMGRKKLNNKNSMGLQATAIMRQKNFIEKMKMQLHSLDSQN